MNIPYAFKECSKCGEWLVANKINFYKEKRGKWGLKGRCKKCDNKRNKEYYENNKKHKKEYSKEYYENKKEYYKEYRKNNKEYFKEYRKEYYENNKEHLKKYSKEYYENNKEYYKEYRKNNKEYIDEYNKEYRKNNPQVVFNYSNKRRNKLENQGRGIDEIQWYEMMMFFDFKCAYSNINLGYKENRSVDHILALDNGGLNEIWNCIPMVKSYNSSKNKRIDVMNWYLEQEYFDIERLNKIVEWQIYAYEKWGGEEFGELILITDLFEE